MEDGLTDIKIVVMKDNGPFKISVEHWDTKLTVEKDHSE